MKPTTVAAPATVVGMTMMMRRWATAVATGLATSSLLAFGSPSWAAPSAPSSATASAEPRSALEGMLDTCT
ncbi:hypothetical protein [Streptomyces violaceusniger]|uniref:hypothetical protein n=1 Tax=Streptomyces violaceusniger TaxID=68280 RepID=UPI0010F62E57